MYQQQLDSFLPVDSPTSPSLTSLNDCLRYFRDQEIRMERPHVSPDKYCQIAAKMYVKTFMAMITL